MLAISCQIGLRFTTLYKGARYSKREEYVEVQSWNFGNSSGTEAEPSQKRQKKEEEKSFCRDRESNPGPVDN